jgi:F-type H+-transporting ATPase subunit delta
MAEQITVARPYADAAFDFARERNALPVWSEMLRVAAVVADDPQMRAALDNPRLSAGDKEALFLSICGERLDAEGRNFVRVLIGAERIALLAEIRTLFEAMKDADEGLARASIASAFPISDRELADLKAALERRFGKKVEASVTVDASLIGGVRIAVGDTVIDASVKGELEAMANHLRA